MTAASRAGDHSKGSLRCGLIACESARSDGFACPSWTRCPAHLCRVLPGCAKSTANSSHRAALGAWPRVGPRTTSEDAFFSPGSSMPDRVPPLLGLTYEPDQ